MLWHNFRLRIISYLLNTWEKEKIDFVLIIYFLLLDRVNKTDKNDIINTEEIVDKNNIPSLASESEHTNIKALPTKVDLKNATLNKDGDEEGPNNDKVVEEPLEKQSYLPDGLSKS